MPDTRLTVIDGSKPYDEKLMSTFRPGDKVLWMPSAELRREGCGAVVSVYGKGRGGKTTIITHHLTIPGVM